MPKRASGRSLPLLTLVLCTLLVGPGCNSGTGSSSGLPGALGFNGEVLILEGSLVGPSFAGGPGLIVAFTQFPNTPRVPGTTVGTPSNVLVYNLENFIGAQVSNASLPPLIAESFPGLDPSPNGDSFGPAVAVQGRSVAYVSDATNLVFPPTNGLSQAYVANTFAGEAVAASELVSRNQDGDAGNGPTFSVDIDESGRFVAMASRATNLHLYANNGAAQILVWDRAVERMFLITEVVQPNGFVLPGNRDSRTPKITGDGRFVAFASDASNLTARDTNNTADIFVFDRSKVVMKRASLDGAGMQTLTDNAEPTLSSNGRFVAFSGVDSTTPGGVRQIFLRDCLLGTTTLVTTVAGGVTEGDGDSGSPTLSANGRFLAFQSVATDLVPGDTNGFRDIFVFDRTTGVLARVTVDAAGLQSNADSSNPSLSSDGRFVAFDSFANNIGIVPGTGGDIPSALSNIFVFANPLSP